jgi:hypothetical protein
VEGGSHLVVKVRIETEPVGVHLPGADHVEGEARHVAQDGQQGGGEPPIAVGEVGAGGCRHEAAAHLARVHCCRFSLPCAAPPAAT